MNETNENDQQKTKENLERNIRWKLSIANLLFEIKTDPTTGRSLSIKMFNNDDSNNNDNDDDDNGDDDQNENGKNYLNNEKNVNLSPKNFASSSNYAQLATSLDYENTTGNLGNDTNVLSSMECAQTSSQMSKIMTNSDSGLSSNIESPSITINDKIEFFENKLNNNNNVNYSGSSEKLGKLPDATHRALFKFCARHSDEISLQIGDTLHIIQEFDDQWSEGINLRTGAKGIFPSSLVIDVNYSEFMFEPDIANRINMEKFPSIDFRIYREQFSLNFLGSIEVFKAKGEDVLDESIRRVINGVEPLSRNDLKIPFKCLLDVSDIGIRMYDHNTPTGVDDDNNKTESITNITASKHDYFFSLVQITYCGYQLKNNVYYFAFITRHPSQQTRFACHVFQGMNGFSTRDIAEAVGKAFHRFYNRFVQIAMD